jgi:hypothetical protein
MDCFASLAMTALQLKRLGCLKIVKLVCVRSAAFLAPQDASVMPGLDPGIHQSS